MIADALVWHRLQFAFTIIYHYLFPQLTMGLALLIVVLKALGLRSGDTRWDDAARFWIRIFGINFAVGVVTGIPMEFQFGTNWARFSRFAGPRDRPDARDGGAVRVLPRVELPRRCWSGARSGSAASRHFAAACALFVGSWLSGYFIVATNAFMQHPVGHGFSPDGTLRLADFGRSCSTPGRSPQYAHTMVATVVTASFVMAAVGAYYALSGPHRGRRAALSPASARPPASLSSVLVAFPTGDHQAKLVARHQPVGARRDGGPLRERADRGHPRDRPTQRRRAQARQPDPAAGHAELPRVRHVPHRRARALRVSPRATWPDNIELLYYAFHVMAGLGTLLIGLMALAALLRLARRCSRARAPCCGCSMLAFPFPYIATTAGWMTAELGRQPWLVYGLLRTKDGASPTVHGGHRAVHAASASAASTSCWACCSCS